MKTSKELTDEQKIQEVWKWLIYCQFTDKPRKSSSCFKCGGQRKDREDLICSECYFSIFPQLNEDK